MELQENCLACSQRWRFEVLKWVSENARCTWTERHCAEAAASDNLPLLKWLRKKGCPWDGQVCADAGSKKLLRWALANGCPFGVQEIEGGICGEPWYRRAHVPDLGAIQTQWED